MRGNLTEGRYVTMEANGFTVTNPSNASFGITATPATSTHSDINQRWVVHQLDIDNNGAQFNISSALDGRWVTQNGTLSSTVNEAQPFTVNFLSDGQGYTFTTSNAQYMSIDSGGWGIASTQFAFQLYAVTYSS